MASKHFVATASKITSVEVIGSLPIRPRPDLRNRKLESEFVRVSHFPGNTELLFPTFQTALNCCLLNNELLHFTRRNFVEFDLFRQVKMLQVDTIAENFIANAATHAFQFLASQKSCFSFDFKERNVNTDDSSVESSSPTTSTKVRCSFFNQVD